MDWNRWHSSVTRVRALFESATIPPASLTHCLVVAPFTLDPDGQHVFDGSLHHPPIFADDDLWVAGGSGTLMPGQDFGTSDEPMQGWVSRFDGESHCFEQFAAIASVAGRLFSDLAQVVLPALYPRVILPGMPMNARNGEAAVYLWAGGETRYLIHRWMFAVHEIGWYGTRGSLLRLDRVAWSERGCQVYREFESPTNGPQVTWNDEPTFQSGEKAKNAAPDRFFSVIESDVLTASLCALDEIESRVRELCDSESRAEPKQDDSAADRVNLDDPPLDLITQVKAADILDVSEQTILRWCKKGEFRRYGNGKVSRAAVLSKLEARA